MNIKEWGSFGLLGLIWGSSFLWIKIAVAEVGPFTLVALRLFFGLLGLSVIVLLRRQLIPRERKILLAFLFLAVFSTALPFVLISWSETQIDSAMAAILNGTVPLFTIVIAHFWLQDEKITAQRLGGLIVGFIGVLVLVTRDLDPNFQLLGTMAGQLAMLAAAASYAFAATFTRRNLNDQPPLIQAFMVVLLADALLWIIAPITEAPFQLPSLPITWLALLWLGLLGSCVAYLLFFFLIKTWGPTRASSVTYTFPVVGLILGAIFLNEVIDGRIIFGTALIVGGIGVVNMRARKSQAVASAAQD